MDFNYLISSFFFWLFVQTSQWRCRVSTAHTLSMWIASLAPKTKQIKKVSGHVLWFLLPCRHFPDGFIFLQIRWNTVPVYLGQMTEYLANLCLLFIVFAVFFLQTVISIYFPWKIILEISWGWRQKCLPSENVVFISAKHLEVPPVLNPLKFNAWLDSTDHPR